MVTSAKVGIVIGAGLALVWVTLGFWACFFVAIAMVIGAVIGRVIDGKLNLRLLVEAVRGKRSSS